MFKKLVMGMIFTGSFFSSIASADLVSGVANIKSISFGSPSQAWESSLVVSGTSNLGSCSSSGNDIVLRFKKGEDYSEGYSLALAAYTTGKDIKVFVDPNDKNFAGDCYIKLLQLPGNP